MRSRRGGIHERCLIVARVHAVTILDLSMPDYLGCFQLAREVRDVLAKACGAESFNIVANCGEDAGQTVLHAHLHLVPRYRGVALQADDSWWTRVG